MCVKFVFENMQNTLIPNRCTIIIEADPDSCRDVYDGVLGPLNTQSFEILKTNPIHYENKKS